METDDTELARLLVEKYGFRIEGEGPHPRLRDGVQLVNWRGRGSHNRGDSLRSAGRLVFVRSLDHIRPYLAPIRDRREVFDYFWLLYRLAVPLPLGSGLTMSCGLTYDEELHGSGWYSDDEARRWGIRVGFDVHVSGDFDEWLLVSPQLVYHATGAERTPPDFAFARLPYEPEPEIVLAEQRVRADGSISGRPFRVLERGARLSRYWRPILW